MVYFRNVFLLMCLAGAWISTNTALAQIVITDEKVPEFTALQDDAEIILKQMPSVDGVGTELINGFVVSQNDFPGVLRMTTGGTCTASLVGPASILFAAHCFKKDHAKIRFDLGGKSVRGICRIAPGYLAGDKSDDWAMCLLNKKVSGIFYETIDFGSLPKRGDLIHLSGYGCQAKDGKLDGQLRLGYAFASKPYPQAPYEASTLYTKADIENGEAVLCPGDSGGPAFKIFGT